MVVKALLTSRIVLERSSHQDNSNNTKKNYHWRLEEATHTSLTQRLLSYIGMCTYVRHFLSLFIKYSHWFSNNSSI